MWGGAVQNSWGKMWGEQVHPCECSLRTNLVSFWRQCKWWKCYVPAMFMFSQGFTFVLVFTCFICLFVYLFSSSSHKLLDHQHNLFGSMEMGLFGLHGVQGYIRMRMNHGALGPCGITTDATYPKQWIASWNNNTYSVTVSPLCCTVLTHARKSLVWFVYLLSWEASQQLRLAVLHSLTVTSMFHTYYSGVCAWYCAHDLQVHADLSAQPNTCLFQARCTYECSHLDVRCSFITWYTWILGCGCIDGTGISTCDYLSYQARLLQCNNCPYIEYSLKMREQGV